MSKILTINQECEYDNVIFSAHSKRWQYYYFDEFGRFQRKGRFKSAEQAHNEYRKRMLYL